MQIFNEIQTKKLTDEINKSQVNNNFVLDQDAYYRLMDLFSTMITSDKNIFGKNDTNICFSADIFLSDTIPFMDIELTLSFLTGNNVVRIVIFEKILKQLKDRISGKITDSLSQKTGLIHIGAIIQTDDITNHFLVPIALDIENLMIYPVPGISVAVGDETYKRFIVGLDTNKVIHRTTEILCAWYCLQMANLHPQMKLCFSHPQREKIKKTYVLEKQPKIKEYIRIKKHIIDASAFEEALCTDVNDKKYSCLCWYVQGHFREQKTQDGHKVYVHGYWKGPLRESKESER